MSPKFAVSRILLTVEFSDRCRGAARYAEALGRRFNAELVLLHVFTPYVGAVEQVDYADLSARSIAQRKADLDNFLINPPAELKVRRIVLEGDPAREIVEYARAGSFDLIVMPTHGYGLFRRFLLGSITAKVLHDVSCPVWTGPHTENAPEWNALCLSRISCAIDFGAQSRPVLRWGASMAAEFGANLEILHAIPAWTAYKGSYYFDPVWQREAEETARAQIASLQCEMGIHGEPHVVIGDVPATICQAARTLKTDLLVIGRGYGIGMSGGLRTNAYTIIRESPCPVLSI